MKLRLFTGLISATFIASASLAQDSSVHTETVTEKTYTVTIETSGTLVNASEQTLAFKTPGIVSQVMVKEGQPVRQGQTLARLDTEEIEADAEQAQALLKEANRALERLKKLYANKVVPLDQVQTAETNADVAAARLKAARFNLRHATIEAPAKGTVLRKLIEPNEIVNAQRGAFVFAEEGRGWMIRVGLNDRDVIRIREGDKADIRFDAYPAKTVTGRVHEIAAKASPGTGTFEVEIRLEAPGLRLLSGMVARATLHPASEGTQVRIPLTAIIAARGSEAEVFVLDEQNRVRGRSVRIDHFNAAEITILEGLNPGETLITRGATSLVEGQKVIPTTLAGPQ